MLEAMAISDVSSSDSSDSSSDSDSSESSSTKQQKQETKATQRQERRSKELNTLCKEIGNWFTKDGVAKQEVGKIQKGWWLANEDPKTDIKVLSEFMQSRQPSIFVTAARRQTFRELSEQLFELPQGIQHPNTEEEIAALVEAEVSVVGLKVPQQLESNIPG